MRFGHENPVTIPLESRVQVADRVRIGPYELGAEVKEKVKPYISLTSDTRPDDPTLKMHDGFYYHCNDVLRPEVGDLRLVFSFAGLEGSKVGAFACYFLHNKKIPWLYLLVHNCRTTASRQNRSIHQSLQCARSARARRRALTRKSPQDGPLFAEDEDLDGSCDRMATDLLRRHQHIDNHIGNRYARQVIPLRSIFCWLIHNFV